MTERTTLLPSPGRPAPGGSGPARGATGMDPRLRRRRAAVRRRQGRRRLWVVLAIAAIAVLVVAGWVMLHSPLLAARVVVVRGSAHVSRSRVVKVAGLASHPPLIDVNAGAAAARLEQLPWVEHATVSRHWPDGVVITLSARRPVAAVGESVSGPSGTGPGGTGPEDRWAEVDRSGRVLAYVPVAPANLPGLAAGAEPGAPGSALPPSAAPGLTVAATLPAAFRRQVTGIEVSRSGGVTLTLTTPITVALGDATELRAKYEDVAALLAGASLVAGEVIDVSVPASPLVMAG